MLWIEQQINSILGQVSVDVTIYISIDPSTDGTEQWCASLCAINSNVVLLPSAGSYGGAGKNFYRLIRDVNFGEFDFIAFADQDDIWLQDKLKRATRFLQSGVCDAYSSNVTAFWPDGTTHVLNKAQPQVTWDYLFEAAGPGCTYVFSKRLASQLKRVLYDNWDVIQSITLHDWFCYGYARANGYQWFIDSEPGVLYRQHANNQVGANVGLKSLLSRFRVIKSGWWFQQIALMVEILDKSEDVFVKKWIKLGFFQLLYLATQAHRCRRRYRDKMLFVVICLVSAISVHRKTDD
ncbi:glycosyltransferase [Pseudomonas moorei]|nr:glycosyltransferase [Pseudomonas moorei]